MERILYQIPELINSDWECYGGQTKPEDDNCHVLPEEYNGKEARAVVFYTYSMML